MSSSINKATIIGNLGIDPMHGTLDNGTAVANIRVATTERYRDRSTGELKEATEWHNVVLFGRLAEACRRMLRRGTCVYVEGRIRTRRWRGRDGAERYTTEIVGSVLRVLCGGRDRLGASEPHALAWVAEHGK
ncbi:Single-stranded DNA-binding protein [Candidatus Tremblaya princeps]|uniref:Single-stranded DNA-binding protein n=1 Tax=Tremblaya princeps TaxID=189385 RepID=A0A143WNF0_TREPR|nr:Single-stranded DNA-binding protein [Candidatus Tremblaya princeps]